MEVNPFLSIVIPAYDEKNRLPKTLDEIYAFLKRRGLSYEMIVVGDGSSDGTSEIVKRKARKIPTLFLKKHSQNRGKGAAVRTGILTMKGETVLFTDADLSTPIEPAERLTERIVDDGYDIALASRGIKRSEVIAPIRSGLDGKVLRDLFC